MSILSVIPVPRTIAFGGSIVAVRELTLSDLARIQAWLDGPSSSAFDADLEALEAETDPERRRVLAAKAILRAEDLAPEFGTRAADAKLRTPPGAVLVVSLATGLDGEELLELLGEATASEYSALSRIAFGANRRIGEYLTEVAVGEPELDEPEREDSPIDWIGLFGRLVSATGWTPDVLAGLTLTQCAAALGTIAGDSGSVEVASLEQAVEIAKRRRAIFDRAREELDAEKA